MEPPPPQNKQDILQGFEPTTPGDEGRQLDPYTTEARNACIENELI